MLKKRKIPMRMCVGCREMKAKLELVRVVRSSEGVCSLDRTGRAPGRGAYLCDSVSCLQRARKSRALERALEATIDASVYDALTALLKPEEA